MYINQTKISEAKLKIRTQVLEILIHPFNNTRLHTSIHFMCKRSGKTKIAGRVMLVTGEFAVFKIANCAVLMTFSWTKTFPVLVVKEL